MLLIKRISRALLLCPGCSHTPWSQANHPNGLVGVGLDLRTKSYPVPTARLLKGLRKQEGQGLPRLGRQFREVDKSISKVQPPDT